MAKSLEKIIKAKITLFEDSSADDATKNKGLKKLISELKKPNNTQEINSDDLEKINKALKGDPEYKEKLDVLNKVVEMLSTPKAEIKNTESVGNKPKPKPKQEIKPPKKEPLKQKTRSNSKGVKGHTKKTSIDDSILLVKIEKIIQKEIVPLTERLTNIENKVKNLKDLDLNVNKIKNKNKEIQKTLEELGDGPPVYLKKLTDKFDTLNEEITNLDVGGVKKTKNDVPKDVQAIEELTKYMGDGLQEFDHIAKYYVSQQIQFEKNEKLQANLDSKIRENKELALKEGEKKSKVAIAREIYASFPTDFNKFKSIFENIMSERYEKNEKITTTSENLQKYEIEIEDTLEADTTYIIKTPAILIDDEILIKATVEVSK